MNKTLLRRKLWLWIWLLCLLCRCQVAPSIPEELGEIPFEPGHPVTVASNPRTGYVYITNTGFHVGVFQGLEQVAALHTGERHADALAIDEERGWVYVVNEHTESVTVIRETTIFTTVETVGRNPLDIAVNPQNGWAYAVSGYSKFPPRGEIGVVEGNATVISGTQMVGSVPLGRILATHVVADPTSGYVYVGGGTGNVNVGIGGQVIAVEGLNVVTQFDLAAPVRAMDVDPRNGNVYILDANTNLLQLNGIESVQQVNLWQESGSPHNMQVHPVTGDVYITYVCGLLIVRDMKAIGTLADVGCSATKMTIDSFTGNVYIANFYDDIVAVVNGTELLTIFEVGWYPYGIGVNPANGWVYVSNTNDNTVTILGFPDN